jgi:hypothetical protein
MKKVLQILFLLLLSERTLGQNHEDFVIEKYFVLTSNELSIESSVTDKNDIQKKLVFEIIQDTTNYFCLDEPERYISLEAYENYLAELYSNFKFIDLDNDNDLDIVFHGFLCGGHESESILIYLNKNNKYERTIWNSGKVVDFKNNKEFIIYEYPCCAMIENTLKKYEIQRDTIINVFNLTFYNSPVLHIHNKEYENIMPKKLSKEKDAKLISGAEVNFIPKDSIYQPIFIENNLIIKTEKELNISVYGQHVDIKGITWLYCKIPAQTEKINGTTNYFFAWTKKKYCR